MKLFHEWWEEEIKENDGQGEFKYDIFIHCKNICKCHNVPPPSTKIKNIYYTVCLEHKDLLYF
jgi:hypothetical protein